MPGEKGGNKEFAVDFLLHCSEKVKFDLALDLSYFISLVLQKTI